MLLSASVTFYWRIIPLLLFGFSIKLCHLVFTVPAAELWSLSTAAPSAPCCLSQLTTFAPAPLHSVSVSLLASTPPPSLHRPPSPPVPSSLQSNHLMEQLSVLLFNHGSLRTPRLTFTKCIVCELYCPPKHRHRFSAGKRRKGGAKEALFFSGLNPLMLQK